MSEGIVIALIGLLGSVLGAAIAGLAAVAAAGIRGKGESSISCGLVGLLASLGAAGGLVLGAFFGASLMQGRASQPIMQSNSTVSPAQGLPSLVTQPPIPTTLPQAVGGYIPKSPEEAAALFGGPPASAWKQCPGEPLGCWTFALPGTSYRLSVPENCLRPDGSIDSWRYGGGYGGAPDEIQGTTRIWNNIEAATIRCH
jgi:hypothetical protein